MIAFNGLASAFGFISWTSTTGFVSRRDWVTLRPSDCAQEVFCRDGSPQDRWWCIVPPLVEDPNTTKHKADTEFTYGPFFISSKPRDKVASSVILNTLWGWMPFILSESWGSLLFDSSAQTRTACLHLFRTVWIFCHKNRFDVMIFYVTFICPNPENSEQ